MIYLSVVIPTFNRFDTLLKVLEGFSSQSIDPKKFEVIIIDDGSTDNTSFKIKKIITNFEFQIYLIHQKNTGPAAARNKGIKKSRGKIILIINDDTVPGCDLIKRHLSFHRQYPQDNYALLGLVTWHPQIKTTPFMYWLENGGPYFSFNSIKDKNAGWQRFWTCNISLKKDFLIKNGLFDESFPTAAWEDFELGYRLSKSDLKLLYDKKAYGYHYHPTTIRSIRNKMVNNGRCALMLKNKLSEKYLPPIVKHSQIAQGLNIILFNPLTIFCMEKLCGYFENKYNTGFLYNLLLLHYRLDGLKSDK